jgi:D-ribose pyranase
MLRSGIVNPAILALLSRVRHTNTLLIADIGFPSVPGVEVVDLSVVRGMPQVPEVLSAVLAAFSCGEVTMSAEFLTVQPLPVQQSYQLVLGDLPVKWLPHRELKALAPAVTGILRTGDTTRFGNVLLQSA